MGSHRFGTSNLTCLQEPTQRPETLLPEWTLHPGIDSLNLDSTLTFVSYKPFRIPVLLTIKWKKWSWNGLESSSLLEQWIEQQAEPSRNLKIGCAWCFPFGNTPQGRFPHPLSFSRKAHLHVLQPRCLRFKPEDQPNSKAEWERNAPDTPSPKKNKVGGPGNPRYGRIAWDLSCPNPLGNKIIMRIQASSTGRVSRPGLWWLLTLMGVWTWFPISHQERRLHHSRLFQFLLQLHLRLD